MNCWAVWAWHVVIVLCLQLDKGWKTVCGGCEVKDQVLRYHWQTCCCLWCLPAKIPSTFVSYTTIFSMISFQTLCFFSLVLIPVSPFQLLFSIFLRHTLSLCLSLPGWTGKEPTNTAIKRTPVWVWKHYQGLAKLTLPLHTLTWMDVFVCTLCVEPTIRHWIHRQHKWHLALWTNNWEGYNTFCMSSTSKK